jgi:YbgC/YbaW family acyl-CoA thioester hydrolase
MNRSDFVFSSALRVRWAEVDMQKIVFNGHYLMYFDTAMADYWRALALPYEDAMHALGGDLYVKKASIEYNASARYDDRLDVALRCAKVGNSSIQFQGGIFRQGQHLVSGELVYVYADPQTQKSQAVPSALRDLFTAFEASLPMTTLNQPDWAQAPAGVMALRHAVFAQEQGIDAALMSDAADAQARHAVVCNRMGQVVAAGRCVQLGGGVGKIGRMVTHRALRGSGLGAQVLQALVARARQDGLTQVTLHAQTAACDFYAAHGFRSVGAPFEEAGLAHQQMDLALS